MEETTDKTLNTEAAESSPAAEVTNTQESAPVETSQPVEQVDEGSQNDAKPSAEPSAAGDKDANKRATLLDVVKAAYEGKPDPKSSNGEDKTDTAQAKNAEVERGQDDTVHPKDGLPAQADKVPFHNHPRWKEMLSERDALKPKAEQFEKITKFMSDAGLSAKEMADGMHVMAMMKTNPQEAYKALQGYVNQLAPIVGEVLPDDIRRKVDEGFVDPESAKELAMLKAERDLIVRRQAEMAQRAEQEAVVNNQRAMQDAVAQWETTEKAKDPDWSVKYEMVMDRVKALLVTERPSNPSEAIEIARRALSDVNTRLRPYTGRNTTIKSPTSSLSSANTRPAPRTLHDVVLANLNQ